MTLKVKFNDYEVIIRSRSVPVAVSSRSDIECLSSRCCRPRCRCPSRSGFWEFHYPRCKAEIWKSRSLTCLSDNRGKAYIVQSARLC